ncbi:hypothetical protein MVEN_02641300 [Mycena venus]|uniref:Uncharacterized protein n=1 Tax=Mycena venus TaxID=2733690 RepID=A0A8H6TVD0_9AGAR|nr:hypothetical protein MVEN_02641300 [Mycena venus]
MDRQLYRHIQPVPSSVTEALAAQNHMQALQQQANRQALQQQERASSQRAPQVSPDGFYAPPQHPVAYSHGYPTPPSHPSALSPVVEAQQQQLMLANSQHSTMTPPSRGGALPPDGQSSFRPNLDIFPSAYPTPPAHQSALLSPNAPGANNFHAAMFGRLDTHARHPSVSGSQLLTPIELRPSQPQLAHSSTTPQASWAPHQQRSSQPGPSTVPRPLQPSHTSVSHPRQLSASVSNSAAYGAQFSRILHCTVGFPLLTTASHPARRPRAAISTCTVRLFPPLVAPPNPDERTPPTFFYPHYLPATTRHAAERPVLESAWAEYTKKLEGEVKSLTARKEEADAQNAQLTTEREGMRRTIRELLKTVESQREQLRGGRGVHDTRKTGGRDGNTAAERARRIPGGNAISCRKSAMS